MCELDGCRADQLERKNSWMTVAEQSITEKRDLRTGTPVWAAYRQHPIATQALLAPCKTDLLIVGAGITGALLAEATSAEGLSTILIDRRPPGHGSTAASTALLQFEIDTPLIRLAADIGLEAQAEVEPISLNLRQVREDAEKHAVLRVLARVNGNLSKAAELLGVSRPTLYDLMHRFGLR